MFLLPWIEKTLYSEVRRFWLELGEGRAAEEDFAGACSCILKRPLGPGEIRPGRVRRAAGAAIWSVRSWHVGLITPAAKEGPAHLCVRQRERPIHQSIKQGKGSALQICNVRKETFFTLKSRSELTQYGDVSNNIIPSINIILTIDGEIFLFVDLFNTKTQRIINMGSVAQIKP